MRKLLLIYTLLIISYLTQVYCIAYAILLLVNN